MADDETNIKVIFEADTSGLDDALKKTAKEAQKIAQKGSSFDRKTLNTAQDLRKEAVKSAKFNDNSYSKSIKANALEIKQLTTQKQQFRVQTSQAVNMGKLFNQQNKARTTGLVLSNKLLKNEQGMIKAQTIGIARQKQATAAMKNMQQVWKKNQETYGGLQSARRASSAAMQQHIGGRWTPPPSNEAPDEPERKERSNIGPMVRQVMGVIASALKEVADFAIQPMMQGYQAYLQYGQTAGRTIGQGNIGNIDFARAQALAFDKTETVGQAYGVARATGQLGAVNTAQGASRFYGGSVDEVTGFMGSLTRGGQGFNATGGGAGRTQLHRLLRDATASGLDRSRVGEHLEAVSSAIEMTGQSLAGNVDAGQISGLLAMIGSTGRSGFQGARGMNVLSQIDQGFKSGGRDDYSQAMQLGAYGFGVAGRDTDYYTARGRMEQGIFGQGGSQNLLDVVNFVRGQTGNRQEQVIGAQESGLFGNLTQSQIEGLFDAVDSSGGDLSSLQDHIDTLRSSQGSVEEQIRDNLKSGQANIAQRVVDLNNRLVNIGEEVFPAMANIQDAVISVQNTLLEVAVPILQTISDAVSAIRDFIATPAQEEEAAAATSARFMNEAQVIASNVQNARTAEAAMDSLDNYRRLERQIDTMEQRNWQTGHGPQARALQQLGEHMAINRTENLIPSVEAIRQREAADERLRQLTGQPAQNATPPVQVNVQTGPTNVNVPGAQPNSMRDTIPTGFSGVHSNY